MIKLTWHAGDVVLGLEVLGNGDVLRTIIRVGEGSFVSILVLEVFNRPLGRRLGVHSRDTDAAEDAEVLLQVRVAPIASSLLEAYSKLRRSAVEDLTDSTSELLRAPEGTIGNIDVDREGLVEFVIENRTEGRKDTLEGLDTAAKVEALFTALEE